MIVVDIDPTLDSQQFRQDFDGIAFMLKFIWNYRDLSWNFELYTPEGVLVASTPLLTGVDLFSEYRSLGTLPPGRFVVVDMREGYPEFEREDLGINVKLIYATKAEYDAITGP